MTQAMEKMDKQARITLGEDVNIGATLDAVLTKNRYFANLAAIPGETAKRTDDALFDSALKGCRLPDIDRINQGLQKVQEITVAANLLWQNKKTARKINMDTVEIINKVCKKKFAFGNGKSFRCIVGGLFYLLGFRYDDPKKQREIAIVLQITDVSIRSSYKQWLKDFPDLFKDIIAKLADQEFRRHCYHSVRPQCKLVMGGCKSEDE
ncbi:MAG: hypothetical protein ABSF44_07250 [Candidatus Bathyarchaeia archaeon]|jgi:hypothetical protein